MAFEVLVSPLFRALSDKLQSLAQQEVDLVWGVEQAMNKLAGTLSTIQKVLHDAEEKQVADQAVAVWLTKLRALAFDAEDILEEWEMDAPQLQLPTFWTSGFWRMLQVCSSPIFSCFCFEQISLRRRMAKRVNELEQKFDAIDAERSRFELREGVVERRIGRYINPETSSLLSQPVVYGRDEERDYVIGQLLDGAKTQQNLTVCPIVGFGGLGKTAVAQYCFNDSRVQNHFEVRIWVCVSDDFDLKRLTKEVIVSISEEPCDIEQLDTLQRKLGKKLENKRFLLVLDDVWSENQENWNSFTSPLKSGAIGSSIIVTTRLEKVALITQTCPPWFLKPMSADDCWSLFRQHAFGMGEEGSPNLLKIGKQIVAKCGGVPLAARVLGSLLLSEPEEEWLFVKDNEIWNLPQSETNTILPILRLSYSHLSPELKQCFAYCAVFPKDYVMIKEDLIDLWMANNLIQPVDGRRMEDTGNRIFKELSLRSFLQDERNDIYGVVCRMHDLLHDLACSINLNECCHLDEIKATTMVPGDIRHLSVSESTYRTPNIQSFVQSAANLRTFLLLDHGWGLVGLPHVNLACLSSLRALSLSMVETVPDTVSKLKHLRYLDCSDSRIESFPESLCELRNLQTLKLWRCYRLLQLPKGMGKMSCLRHLRIDDDDMFLRSSEMPAGIGKLTCLQTLGIFIVGTNDGHRINELQGLKNLRGRLTIRELQHVKTTEEAREANLIGKPNILSLSLEWSVSDDAEHENDIDVLEGLQPHSNLKRLHIRSYQGLTFPSWFEVSFLRNLVEISMLHCKKCEHLPSALGKLPLLRSLSFWRLTSVKFLFATKDEIAEAFLSLKYLELSEMPELEDWFPGTCGSSEEVILFPRLSELIIEGCARVRTLPGVEPAFLTRLSIKGCPNLSKVEYQHLNSLQKLTIGHGMTSLPDGVQHVSSTLRELQVRNCPALISLPDWIGNFTELQELCLLGCGNLKSLPDGLQHLTNLQRLQIWLCHPELHGRCKKSIGEDWPKIAHIPNCDFWQ